jgi:tripartite-type tricarboxylate transporter receptor subunit TctC
MKRFALVSGALCALAAVTPVLAQNYPVKPIRIIVPFPAGGPTDTHSRWAAQQLTAAFGQQVIVENRAGAGGTVGTAVAAKAAPDGYTLLGGNPGPLTIAGTVRKKLSYDGIRDFTPITLIARSASCMCAHPNVPAKNLKEFVALARSSPGKINYATPGVGTVGHLAIESFAVLAGIRMNMVPYKGAAIYLVDLMAGYIDYAQVQVAQAAPHVRNGKLRALGVTASRRSSHLPNVPTAEEQGFKGWTSYNWNGILAPAGTPQAIVDRIHAVLSRQLTDPGIRKQLEAVGFEPAGEGPAEFAAFMKDEVKKWADVAKKAGIEPM